MTKEQFSIVKEYNGLMENIYNHLKPLETDLVELSYQDGRDYSGYWSHTVGDMALRYNVDLSAFYYNGAPIEMKGLDALIEEWRDEIEEETKNMGEEEAERFESEYFENNEHWGIAVLEVMLYDKDFLDSDEQEEFKEFDNVAIITTRLKSEYGRNLGDIADEVLIGVNKDSDMDKLLEILNKEIDEKVDLLNKYFTE